MEDGGERKADQGRGERAAEDDDDGVDVEEHPDSPPIRMSDNEHDAAGDKPEAGCDIHERYPNADAYNRSATTGPAQPRPAALKGP